MTAESNLKKVKRRIDDLSIEDKKNLKAIAVKYDINKDRAPKIIASGKSAFAEEILRIAEENHVPLYEDPTLADLLSKLDIDTEIPPELYTLVAEILAFVYQLDKLAKKKETLRKRLMK
ncbi:MAG: EscU/YscU/HrcU family type III secretion system export apparatus switch protein [Candidatus Margulisiibacteriota bacterium]|jgi:flagellar biosynthesis protein